MHSTGIVVARGFQPGSRADDRARSPIGAAPMRAHGVGRLALVAARLVGGDRPAYASPRRELPTPFC